MQTTEYNELGAVHIAGKVIAVIAAGAALAVPGVAFLATTFTEKFGKAAGGRGIDVKTDKTDVELTVRLVARHGYRIPDVAIKVQQSVKEAVESLTECAVTAVHITVQDILYEDGAAAERAGAADE